MTREEKIMKRLGEHYQFLAQHFDEDRIVGVFLQGSQNYELDYENSDIDSKAIILPTLDEILTGAPMVSEVLLMENDEHVEVKDIRKMFEMFKKQNINYEEILFTDYKILNENFEEMLQPIFDNAERIARADIGKALNCMNGMGLEKHKAMEHPYPSTISKIEKFGYDPKQLHHIIRMRIFMEDFISGKSYKKCLVSDKNDFLLMVKQGGIKLEAARELATICNAKMKAMREEYARAMELTVDTDAFAVLDAVCLEVLKSYIKESMNV